MHREALAGSDRPRVLITRPVAQAEGFAQLCEKIGFDVSLMPCLEIVPVAVNPMFLTDLIKNHRTVLFTSANAVHTANGLQPFPWPNTTVHAIGAATARTLKLHGQRVEFEPAAPYNSEAYLEQIKVDMPDSLLIMKGCGGRDLVQSCLHERGCRVESLDLYERRLPNTPIEIIEDLILKKTPDVISVTSNHALSNLCVLAQSHLDVVRSLPLVVNSARCAELAAYKGFTIPARIAEPAGDQGQTQCLSLWLEERL